MSDNDRNEPHAYGVETLWNRGGFDQRWGLAMEMEEVRQPLDRDDAEQLMAQMIEDGHAPDAVRLVALVVVTRPIPPGEPYLCEPCRDGQHWRCSEPGTCQCTEPVDAPMPGQGDLQ